MNAIPIQAPARADQGANVETARLALESVWRQLAPIVEEARKLEAEASRNPSRLTDPWVEAHLRWLQLFDREIHAVEEVYDASGAGAKLSIDGIRATSDAATKLLGFITTARERLSLSGVDIVTQALRRLRDATNERKLDRGEAPVDLVNLSEKIDTAILESVGKQAAELNLSDGATVATLGVRLRDAGQNAEARPFLEAAADAGDTMAANTLGLILKELGERDEARRRFQESADGKDSQGLYNLGLMYLEDGDRREAERWLGQSTDPRAAERLAQPGP